MNSITISCQSVTVAVDCAIQSREFEPSNRFGPSEYESQSIARHLSRVESEIIAFEKSVSANSLSSPSSTSSSELDDSNDFAGFAERPISPPMATFGGSDSYVEDIQQAPKPTRTKGRTSESRRSDRPRKTKNLNSYREREYQQTSGPRYVNENTGPTTTYFTEDDWAACRIRKSEGLGATQYYAGMSSWGTPSLITDSNNIEKPTRLTDIAGDWMQRMHQ